MLNKAPVGVAGNLI